MNVMQANIAGEPLEDFGQFEIRAAFQCYFHRIPRSVTRPIRALKLMLNIEQPEPEAPGDQNDGQLNLEIGPKTDCPRRQSDDEQESPCWCEARSGALSVPRLCEKIDLNIKTAAPIRDRRK